MRYSSPSILISAPEYLPNRIRSPALTSSATRSPVSSSLPLPTALTSACFCFSLAESGMMIPPTFCSPSSRRFTITRSCKGRKSMSLIIGQCHWRGDQLHEIVYSPQRRRDAEISAGEGRGTGSNGQGRKTPPSVRPVFPIYSPRRVFHEVSRAERPSQQARRPVKQARRPVLLQDFCQGATYGTAGRFDFQDGGQGGSDIVDRDGRMVEARTNARSEENHRHVGVVTVGRRVSGSVGGAHYPIVVRDQLDVLAAPQMVAVGHLLGHRIAQTPAALHLFEGVHPGDVRQGLDGPSRLRFHFGQIEFEARDRLPIEVHRQVPGAGHPLRGSVLLHQGDLNRCLDGRQIDAPADRKSTRLNSSHLGISYAV